VSETATNRIADSVPQATFGPLVPWWAIGLDLLVIVALVAIIVSNWVFGLDFVHVFGGALWITTDILMGFIIGPIMGKLDIPARMVFAKNLMTKMLVVMPTAVICTLASGWQLAKVLGFFSAPNLPNHGWILAAMIVVALLSILAYTFLEPANIVVLLELRKPEPNGLLVGRMMKRFLYCAGILGVLQVSIVVIMVRLTVG
jgi:hypothetical protein